MRAALGREFPIVKLFEFPTVRLIAERLSREADESPAQSETPSGRAAGQEVSRSALREARQVDDS